CRGEDAEPGHEAPEDDRLRTRGLEVPGPPRLADVPFFEHFAGPAGRAGGGGQADGRPGLAGAIGCGFHVEFDVRGPVSVAEKARERLRKQVEVVCPLLRTNPVDDDDSAANDHRAPPRDAYAGVRGT